MRATGVRIGERHFRKRQRLGAMDQRAVEGHAQGRLQCDPPPSGAEVSSIEARIAVGEPDHRLAFPGAPRLARQGPACYIP